MPRTWYITGASRAGTSSGANFVATGRSVPVQAVPGVYYVPHTEGDGNRIEVTARRSIVLSTSTLLEVDRSRPSEDVTAGFL